MKKPMPAFALLMDEKRPKKMAPCAFCAPNARESKANPLKKYKKQPFSKEKGCFLWYAGRDSNPRPTGS